MLRPRQHPLTDAAAGRISMPFLPTLAVVIALSAASLFCPTSRPASPVPRAEIAAATPVVPAPGLTDFARPAPSARPVRVPATLAFAALYPLASVPVWVAPAAMAEAAASPPPHPSAGPRPTARLASAGRPGCPGRRCVEPAPASSQRRPDALAVASAGVEAAEDVLIAPLALPFAAVAETLAPATRVFGQAAGLLQRGAASVKGSVAMLAECLP